MKHDYYHGSSSASFVGVFSRESPGLKPLGRLLELGQVPYTGELFMGQFGPTAKVKSGISAVPSVTMNGAIVYALRHGEIGWTPEKGRENMDRLRISLAKPDVESYPGWFNKKMRETLEGMIQIERLRIENWEKLTNQERELIKSPFSVIYEIQYDGNTFPIQSDYPCEVGIPAVIGLEEMTLYVPREYVERVKILTIELPTSLKVESFRALEKLKEETIKVGKAIERIINKTNS